MRDLPGAVSLQGFQMNASRVGGPAIGGVLYPLLGPAIVFVVNAFTYLFAVAAIVIADFPSRVEEPLDESGLGRLASGFRIAWSDRLIRRVLTTMVNFSFFSLAFIYLMPTLAARNLHMRPKSLAYGLLYAGFGTGAALGAVTLAVAIAATFLAHDPDPASGVALVEATKDKDWIVRAAAIEAIAQRGDPTLEGKLEFFLFDPNSHVRLTAAAAVIRLSAIERRKNGGKAENKEAKK